MFGDGAIDAWSKPCAALPRFLTPTRGRAGQVTTPQLRLSLARTLKVVLDAAPPGGGVAAGLSGIHDALAQAKADPASSPELVSLAETLAKQLPPPPVDLAAEQE